MRFFSKFVTICNICFIVVVVLRYMEYRKNVQARNNSVTQLTWVENVLVILGYGSFFINIIFLATLLVMQLLKKEHGVAKWISVVTVLFFVFQIIYFFTNLIP